MNFDQRLQHMDKKLMRQLNDGKAAFLDKDGAVIASDVCIILDRDVEHPAEFIERITTITVNKSDLPSFDRQGRIQHQGITWRIDGVLADDGYQLTLQVLRA